MHAPIRFDHLVPPFVRNLLHRPRASADDAGQLPADIALDIDETADAYLVVAEVPGVRKQDLRVAVEGNQVFISAEVDKRLEDRHARDGRLLVRETSHGAIARAFTLDAGIDGGKAVARLEDGVLRLTLPKIADRTARTIAVQQARS